MQQIILAVQTPRAGKWNHRWIIPDGCQTDDVTLTNALSKFDSLNSGAIHKDGIVFYRSVEQPSSGRIGREFIFLHYPDFRDAISAHGKTLCNDALEAFFESRMDQFINSIDWDNTDGAMIYHSPELFPLFNELKQALENNQIQSPDKDKDKPKDSSSGFRFLTIMIVILAALFYLNRGNLRKWFDQNPGQNPEISDNGETKPAQPQTPPISGKTGNGKLSSEQYEEWQKLFTLPDEVTDQQRYDMVQDAVNEAFSYYYGAAPNEGETSLSKINSKNNVFVSRLFIIRNIPKPVSFNGENGIQDVSYGIDPVEFRKAINELQDANNAVKQMLELCNQDQSNSIRGALDNLSAIRNAKSWQTNAPDIYPSFFFDSDKARLNEIKEFINFIKENKTINEVCEECSSCSDNDPKRIEYQTWINFKRKFNFLDN